ncbi:MAG: 3',5'-cyclic AMP phosphodiesterase CpdA [Roseivirga sp.]|jgi:sphingomyelin phosphodiesterase acid-like 3
MKNHKLKLLFLVLIIPFLFSFISPSNEISNISKLDTGINILQSGNSKFLTISDVHLNVMAKEVSYGCDTGMDLWAIAQAKFDSLIITEKPNFVLYLGDLPVHAGQSSPCVNADNYIHDGVGTVLEGLRTIAEKRKIPLLYLPGNNDGYGGDYSSFTDSINTTAKTPFTQDPAGLKEWPMINTGNQASLINGNQEFGFFSAYPLGKAKKGVKALRTIMLNTVIFTAQGTWSTYQPKDGVSQQDAGIIQINWLKKELAAAATSNEAVLIAMHIPPGAGSYNGSPNWNQALLYIDDQGNHSTFDTQFNQLVKKYQHNIVGILTSHTHTDGLKRVIDGDKVIELTVSTPGISVNHKNNPGMKVFEYNNDFELMDFTTYYSTPESKYWGNKRYTFSQNYGCSNSDTMLSCIQTLTNNDPQGTQSSIVKLVLQILYVISPQGSTTFNPTALDIVVK